MTRAVQASVAVVAAVALSAAAARADDTPAAPPAPYAPPPAYYAPPPPPSGPAPGALTPQQLSAFEAGSKSHAGALLLSLWIPGLGSIYADHAQGFLVTWLGMGAGIGMVVFGAVRENEGGANATPGDGDTLIVVGSLMIVGFWVYSLVDAWSSVTEYNEVLALRLGMQSMRFTVAPISTGRDLAWGPALSLRF